MIIAVNITIQTETGKDSFSAIKATVKQFNKNENVHKLALSAIRGELFERER